MVKASDYSCVAGAIQSEFWGSLGELKRDVNSTATHASALLIACSDLGFETERISGFPTGSFENHQVLGNTVAPFDQHRLDGCIENAVLKGEIRHVVVCSHHCCRLTNHAIECQRSGKNTLQVAAQLGVVIEQLSRQSPRLTRHDIQCFAARNNALLQIQNLLTYPGIKAKAEQRRLRFHAWVLDDETRRVSIFCNGEFADSSLV